MCASVKLKRYCIERVEYYIIMLTISLVILVTRLLAPLVEDSLTPLVQVTQDFKLPTLSKEMCQVDMTYTDYINNAGISLIVIHTPLVMNHTWKQGLRQEWGTEKMITWQCINQLILIGTTRSLVPLVTYLLDSLVCENGMQYASQSVKEN